MTKIRNMASELREVNCYSKQGKKGFLKSQMIVEQGPEKLWELDRFH